MVWLQVLGVSAGDVVLDLLINCDPVPLLEACMERNAHYLNAATDVSPHTASCKMYVCHCQPDLLTSCSMSVVLPIRRLAIRPSDGQHHEFSLSCYTCSKNSRETPASISWTPPWYVSKIQPDVDLDSVHKQVSSQTSTNSHTIYAVGTKPAKALQLQLLVQVLCADDVLLG